LNVIWLILAINKYIVILLLLLLTAKILNKKPLHIKRICHNYRTINIDILTEINLNMLCHW